MNDGPQNTEIRALLARIEQLETRLAEWQRQHERLDLKVRRNGNHLCGALDAMIENRDGHNARIDSAFERIKNIERSVFPNLMNDIESIHKIVGGDGVTAERNPLDSRNTFPPKSDPEKS